jgi:hypothetical protein
MATETKTKRNAKAEASKFHNRLYRAEVTRTAVGSPILKLAATNPKGRHAQHRQMASFIYELAAEMERRSEDLGARWVISPDPTNARIVLELASDDEATRADEFINRLITDFELV